MNPYDKYTSDNEIPRLTDEVIRKKVNESLRLGLTTMIMMLVCALLAVWVLTGLGFYLKNHTLAGNYPVIVWSALVMIWLVAAGFIVYHARDYVKDRIAYGGDYHVVKRELHTISRDEYQGMRWHYRNGRLYRRPEFRDALYFDGMEKFIVGRKIVERAAGGDVYLIVVFDRAPTVPKFICRTDAYRWP
jgi:hypothetical protein